MSLAGRAIAAWLVLGAVCTADEALEAQRAKLLEQMRSLAEQTKVRLVKDDTSAEFVARPVFRYDDQPRKFVDATLWVWTQTGRPVAFQKVEAMIHRDTDQPLWGHCFTSLADQPLAIEWPGRKPYATTAAGVVLKPLPGSPVAPDSMAARRREMRELARKFSARIVDDPKSKLSAAMRLLPTPIFEYADQEQKGVEGAVLGFSANNTNPDLLLVLESVPTKPKGALVWHFAVARMTTGGLNVAFRDEPIWEAEFVSPHSGPFATWTFFQTARDDSDR